MSQIIDVKIEVRMVKECGFEMWHVLMNGKKLHGFHSEQYANQRKYEIERKLGAIRPTI